MPTRFSLVLTLAAKDFRLFFSDRRAAVLCFTVPIILASVFGLIFHKMPGQSGSPRLPLLIVAEDDGPFTMKVVSELLASSRVEAEIVTRMEAQRRVGDRRPGVAVVFPRGFDRLSEWLPGTKSARPSITVLHNPISESEGQWAEGVVSEIVMRCLARDRLAAWAPAQANEPMLPFDVETHPLSDSLHDGFNSYTHSFSGMTLQYLLFWGMESGILLLRERQRSLWSRMRAAPVPLSTVILGKTLSTGLIALMQVLTTFGFGYIVFGVTVGGSLTGFALLAIGVSALSAATGLLVAAIGGTEARARSVCILVILGVSMLGGLWLPSFVLPGWARDMALSLPTTWAMRGLDQVTWQGQGLLAALPSIAVVAGFTAVFLAVAVAKLVTSEARRRRGMT